MKNTPRRIFLLLVALAVATLLGSCNVFDLEPRYRVVEPEAVVPKSFLYNPDQTYNDWMDTPLRVHYHETSVSAIFSDQPFENFSYELYDIPSDMKPVSIDALGQTRRQLLWAIAHDNNLKMTLLTTEGGRPSVVVIRWRGNRTTNERGSVGR
ncbi:MAG: hypothetical protein ACI8XO_003807 [Verrucomicrobiales bacterium]|jgi:hypothetical protein